MLRVLRVLRMRTGVCVCSVQGYGCRACGAHVCVPTKCERVRDGSVRVEREGGVHVQSVDEVSLLATARIVTDSYIGF